MCKFKIRQASIFVLFVLVACRQGKVKVLWDDYSQGKPKTVYYFDNKKDAAERPIVDIKNGVGHANKPISFDEEGYYENGKLRIKGRYIKGQACGLWQYFYETGVRQARCYYLNGVTRDTVYCWYPSGRLKRLLIEVDTVNHRWHGIDYYQNGNKFIESNLFKDSLDNWTVDGDLNEWFPDGKLKFQAIMKNNWSAGKWKEWDSAGNVKEGETPVDFTL